MQFIIKKIKFNRVMNKKKPIKRKKSHDSEENDNTKDKNKEKKRK